MKRAYIENGLLVGLVIVTFGVLIGCNNPVGDAARPQQTRPVAENGCFRLETPNGGERYTPGDTVPICFSILQGKAELISSNGGIIDLFCDGRIVAQDLQGDEQVGFADESDWDKEHCFEWVIPDSIIKTDSNGMAVYENGQLVYEPFPLNDGYYVVVNVYDPGAVAEPVSDRSDGTFTIGW